MSSIFFSFSGVITNMRKVNRSRYANKTLIKRIFIIRARNITRAYACVCVLLYVTNFAILFLQPCMGFWMITTPPIRNAPLTKVAEFRVLERLWTDGLDRTDIEER